MSDPRDALYKRLRREGRRDLWRLLARLTMWTLLGVALAAAAWRY